MATKPELASVAIKVKAYQEASKLCWQMAVDTADNRTAAAEYRKEMKECMGHYASAIREIKKGDLADAEDSLESARQLETKTLEALPSSGR